MATIGAFTPTQAGNYVGALHLLAFDGAAALIATNATNPRAPAFRLLGDGGRYGRIELGAAWLCERRDGAGRFLSVKLDFPGLAAPLYAILGRAAGAEAGDDGLALIWTRPRVAASRATALDAPLAA